MAPTSIVTTQIREGDDFIKRTGTVVFTANQSMGGFRLGNLGTPTASDDAATKGYIDGALASAVGYTDEKAQDASAAMITAGTHSGVSFVYNDAANSLSATVTVVATPPGGASGQLQYNNAGAFGGTAAAVYATSGNLLTITAQVATDKPVVVKGALLQSANLQEWQDSTGAVLGKVTGAGEVVVGTQIGGRLQVSISDTTNSSTAVNISHSGAVAAGFGYGLQVQKTGAAQTNIATFFHAAGGTNNYAIVTGSGQVGLANAAFPVAGCKIYASPDSAGDKVVIVRGAASQTANLQEWQNSTGVALAGVDSTGTFKAPMRSYATNDFSIACTTTTQYGWQIDDNGYWNFVRTGVGGIVSVNATYGICLKDGYFLAFSTGDAKINVATPDVWFNRAGTRTIRTSGNQRIECQNAADLPLVVRGMTAQAGTIVQLQGQSSTTAGREMADIDTQWVTNTDASRKAKLVFRVWDTAVREALSIEATGNGSTVAIRGSTVQTGNLQEWRDTSGIVMASVDRVGVFKINSRYGIIPAAADGATVVFDLGVADKHTVILGGNRTLTVSNDQTGHIFLIILRQDATGGRTVTWWSGIIWPGGVTPTLSTAPNSYDAFNFVKLATGVYMGFAASAGGSFTGTIGD